MRAGLLRGILTASILIMEASWLFLLVYLLNDRGTGGALNIPGLFLVFLLAFGANWPLSRYGWPRGLKVVLNIIIWGIVSLLVIKFQMYGAFTLGDVRWLQSLGEAVAGIFRGISPAVVALIGCAILWWSGQRLAYMKIEFSTSVREFQFGLLVVLPLLFVAAGLDVDLGYAVPAVLVFFSAALLTLSLAHARENHLAGGAFGGNWLGILLMCISTVLILGLIVGSIITPELLRMAAAGLIWLWSILVKGIAFIASLFPAPDMPAPDTAVPDAAPALPQEPDYSKIFVLPEVVRNGLRYGWYLLMIGFLLVFLWRVSEQFFVWLRRSLAAASGAEFEPLHGAFGADIRALLGGVFAWFAGWRSRFRRQVETEPREITSVRQLYRQLLRWGGRGGLPRVASHTADEYLAVLQERLPAYGSAAQYITEWYVVSRYGHVAPSAGEMEELKRSWQLLKQQRLA